ncbi:hypothetical protein N9H93_05395 [Rhizobiaceae bacterium]|nr:hypothetical protein [Rhizobiaceae bacterium]
MNGLLTLRGLQLPVLRLEAEGDAGRVEVIGRVLANMIGYTGYIVEGSQEFRRKRSSRTGELRRLVGKYCAVLMGSSRR